MIGGRFPGGIDCGIRPAGRQCMLLTSQFSGASVSVARTCSSSATGSNASISSRRAPMILAMASDDTPEAKRVKDMKMIEDFLPDLDELDRDELQGFLDLELESDFDFPSTKHYEIMFLVHEKNVDEVPAVVEKVKDFITENKGIIHRLDNWGMRNLAYKIKKATRANYLLMNIEINNRATNSLNTLLEKDERVIRHMVMSQKAAITTNSVPPEEYRSSRIGEREQEEEDEDYDENGEEEEEEEEEEKAVVFQSQ